MANLEDELKDFLHHSATVNSLMLAYFKQQIELQNRTAENSPPSVFNLWNVVLPSPTALQIIPGNPSRHKVGLANAGPSNILYHTMWFDPTEILRNFSDPLDPDSVTPGYNQSIQIGFLQAGMAVEINSIRAVWAYSLGSQAGSNQNAILSIQDSLYMEPHNISVAKEPGESMSHMRKEFGSDDRSTPNTNSETAMVYK